MDRALAELLMALLRRLPAIAVVILGFAVIGWLMMDANSSATRYAQSVQAVDVSSLDEATAASTKPPTPAFPLIFVGPQADFYLRAALIGFSIFVILMATHASGRPIPAQPDLDALGPEALERRNGNIMQFTIASFVMTGMLGFAAAIATGEFGWLLILFGIAMLLYVIVPFAATLPRGMQRVREFLYYTELKFGRQTAWSNMLAVIWVALGCAAIAGGIGEL